MIRTLKESYIKASKRWNKRRSVKIHVLGINVSINKKYQSGGIFMARYLTLEKEWKIRFEEYQKSGLSTKARYLKNGFK